ncbi:MAG: hypothetical protein JSU74_06555 [Candidatus Zixiibacteriota bacterium]|nr:MAG: hypothetical protein JSU74_06555 [candidate division Zixibacteria bacterium]
MATKAKKSNNSAAQQEVKWPYGKKNYLIFAAAMLVIIIGFITLAKGSITLAPILLVIGYCVLLPIALIIKDKPEEDSPQPEQ